jgi:hypothetical protein
LTRTSFHHEYLGIKYKDNSIACHLLSYLPQSYYLVPSVTLLLCLLW